MTTQINVLQPVQGGVGVGLLLPANNPNTVPDALGAELVNRGIATIPTPLPAVAQQPLRALMQDDGDWAYGASGLRYPLRPLAKLNDNPVPNGQLVSNWAISGTVTGTITNTADAVRGQVLNINASTAGTRLSAISQLALSFRSQCALSLWLQKDANLAVIDLEVFCGDYSLAKRTLLNKAVGNLDAGAWQRIPIPLCEFESIYGGVGLADTNFITGIRIGATPVAGQTTTLQVAGLAYHEVPQGGVSFFFDDARLDTYTDAFRIMRQYGFVGAVAPEYTRLGTSPSYSLMTQANVSELYAAGWDICGHHYFNMPGQSEATAVGIYQACKNWMRANGYTRGDHIWAWPGGARDAASELIARRYWQVTRRVGSFGYSSVPGIFDIGAPPNWYVSSGQDAAQLLAMVDKVQTYGGHIVFTFHSLVNNKVAPEDYLISDFAALCAGLAARGVPVLPVSKVWPKY